jgi:hypothetical protein
MLPFSVLFFVPLLAQATPPGSMEMPSAAELSAAAAASPRPAECSASRDRGESPSTLWDRARRPAEGVFCDALAQGYSELVHAPQKSLLAAARAERALPGRAATVLLRARAEARLGHDAEAFQGFQRATKLAPRSVDEPGALHDYAVAALGSGHRVEALAAYRALVPRASLLSDTRERQRVFVEAALCTMSVGPENLTEAVGYLTEARRERAAPGLSDLVLGALALALDREGRRDEARGVAAEAGGPTGLIRLAEHPASAGPAHALDALGGELHAVAAIIAGERRPELARAEWRAYLDSPAGKSGPFALHAKKKLEGSAAPRRRQGAR